MVANRPKRFPCFLLAGSFSQGFLIFMQPMKSSGDTVGNGLNRSPLLFVLFPRYSSAFSQRFSNTHAAGQMLYSNLKTHPACLHKDRHSVIFFSLKHNFHFNVYKTFDTQHKNFKTISDSAPIFALSATFSQTQTDQTVSLSANNIEIQSCQIFPVMKRISRCILLMHLFPILINS
jgi:hypothetical protein